MGASLQKKTKGRWHPVMVGVGGLMAAVLITGCSSSSPSKQKWLSFFFDGVPESDSGKTNLVAKAGPAVPSSDPEAKEPIAPAAGSTNKVATGPALVLHQPYAEEQCSECHDMRSGMRLKAKPKDLCFTCHDDFLEKAVVKHSPVENGECLSCHDPHQAPNKKLLTKAGKALCFDCHDDPAEKSKFVHSGLEDCYACHTPHAGPEEKLLVKNAAKLCFDCHETKDMEAVKGHAGMGNTACLKCHEHHAGGDKFLLKPDAAKKKEKEKVARADGPSVQPNWQAPLRLAAFASTPSGR